MKILPLAIALLLFASSTRGNVYIPHAKLAGETVHVRLLKDTALVTAIFEFESLDTRDAKMIYFPIFAETDDDPIKVLANAGFELKIGDKLQGMAVPCAAPVDLGNIPTDPRVFWFSANIDDSIFGEKDIDLNSNVFIKVTYTQSRIRSTFHYLPIIIGAATEGRDRSWKYQMMVYSGSKIARVTSKASDYEQLGDSVVVYLKDRQPVEIQ